MSLFLRSYVLAIFLAPSALAACGSSDPTIASKPAPGTRSGDFSVFPEKVFVGVDESGKALGSAPVAVTGASGAITWTSASTSIASASGTAKAGTIAGVKKGTSTVTVKAGTKTAKIDVTVIAYAAADKTKGQTEFESAKCGDCHGASGPDVTPSGIGKHEDDEIIAAVVSGKNPEGAEIEGNHRYTATAAIVAYLRSLPARTDTPIKDE